MRSITDVGAWVGMLGALALVLALVVQELRPRPAPRRFDWSAPTVTSTVTAEDARQLRRELQRARPYDWQRDDPEECVARAAEHYKGEPVGWLHPDDAAALVP